MDAYNTTKEVYICDSVSEIEQKIKDLSKNMIRFSSITLNRLVVTAYLAPEFS